MQANRLLVVQLWHGCGGGVDVVRGLVVWDQALPGVCVSTVVAAETWVGEN